MARIPDKRGDKAAAFAQRMNKVLDYIDQNLADELSLEQLAGVAAFSPFHFHRLFRAWTGETLHDFVRRCRLEKAGGQLEHNTAVSIATVAEQCGFNSSEAFSRAFAQHFGMPPSAWRKGGHTRWQAEARPLPHEGDGSLPVTVRDLPTQTVAYIRVFGDYAESACEAWEQLLPWIEEHGLQAQPRLGMALDDPQIAPASHCRYDACVVLPAGWNGAPRMSRKQIAGGWYACSEYRGPRDGIGAQWTRMMREWLPTTGHALGEPQFFEAYACDQDPCAPGGTRATLCMPVILNRF